MLNGNLNVAAFQSLKEMEDYDLDTLLGEYSSESGLVEVNFPRANFIEALTYSSTLETVEHADILIGRNLTNKLDLLRLLPVLTYEHEQNHFQLLTSTPFGMYVWRIQQALHVNLGYLSFLHRLGVIADPPYWRNISRRAHHFDSVERAKIKLDQDLSSKFGRTEWHANFVAWEMAILRGQWTALLLGGISKGQFCELTNLCDALLGLRSETTPKRQLKVSASNGDNPLVGTDELSPLGIIELSALQREIAILLRRGADPNTFDEWKHSSLHGIYNEAHEYSRKHFGSGSSLIPRAVEIALGGPVDLVCEGGAVDIDDWYPTSRLEALRKYTKNSVVDAMMPENLQIASHMPRRYRQMSNDVLWGKTFVRIAALPDFSSREVETDNDVLGQPLDIFSKMFKENFQQKSEDNLTRFHNPTDIARQSPFVMFSDSVQIRRVPTSEAEALEAFHLFIMTLFHKFTRSIVFETPLASKWLDARPGRFVFGESASVAAPDNGRRGIEYLRDAFGEELCSEFA